MVRRSSCRKAVAGLVALLVGGDVAAAPAEATAVQEPAEAEETPAAKKSPPPPTAAELLAEVRATRPNSREWWRAQRRLREDHDGTVELIEASAIMLAGARELWSKRGDPSIVMSPIEEIEASQSYALPEAAELKRLVAKARAEVGEWQAILDHAEQGKRGDVEGFLRCGEGAQAIEARLGSREPRRPWLLHWAAICLEAAGQWTEAARGFERLIAAEPNGEWMQGARRSLVEGNFAVARYEEAARHAEAYAARFPKDKSTESFLRIAYMSRLGLGQHDRALAALEGLEGLYMRGYPEMAARYYWARGDMLTDDVVRMRHADQYLVRYGKQGSRDAGVVAGVELGRLKWQLACERTTTLGLCASLSRGPSKDSRARDCADRGTVRFEVFARDAGQAEEGQRYLASALKLAKFDVKIPFDDVGRIEAFREALAVAAVVIADRGFDELLGLLAQVRDASARDIRQPPEPIARVGELAATLTEQYTQLAAKPDSAASAIAAAARIGQIAELRAGALLLREIPRDVTGKSAEAFCAARREQVAPLHAAARAAYERCLELSIAAATFTEYSRHCEEALGRRDPRRFPPLAEIVGVAAEPASRPETIGVQLEAPRELVSAAARGNAR